MLEHPEDGGGIVSAVPPDVEDEDGSRMARKRRDRRENGANKDHPTTSQSCRVVDSYRAFERGREGASHPGRAGRDARTR